jgi:DNA N-6-adenine-methyltransferase (Dam)
MKAAIVQSTLDFAMREINALEESIVSAEDTADDMLWQQAQMVVEQLKSGRSTRQIAKQWINNRTGKPYDHTHVVFVSQVVSKLTNVVPRPRFRDAYNEIANASKTKLAVHHSSETPEHYTPENVIKLVVACLGEIDLDPCSNPGTPNVPARRHFTVDDDGLHQSWGDGPVYMNPPYGSGIDEWVAKLCAEHEPPGRVVEAIALVPARPDTQWFKRLRDYPCCFVEGRLTFVGNDDPAPFPSALFYFGEDLGKFYHYFLEIGDIWQRIEPGVHFGE